MNETQLTVSDPVLRAYLGSDAMNRKSVESIPAVEGCLNLISSTLAHIPIKLYRKIDNEVTEIVDNRVFLLNSETGDTLNANEMKKAMIYDYYLSGGGYAYVNRSGLNVSSIHYVPADYVSIIDSIDVIFKRPYIIVQGKRYFVEDFIKIVRNTENGVSGKSIVNQLETLLSVSYNTLQYEDNLVRTGGNKKGFIKSTKKLSQEAIDRLKKAWRLLYNNSSENVIILNEGLEFQESSNTSVEMQLNESKNANTGDICKIFNVPPAMLTGNATSQDHDNFIKFCILPLVNDLVTDINRSLLLESEKGTYYFEADTDDIVKGDIEKRFNAYKTATESGWLQIDEIREKENMKPLGMNCVKLGLADVLYNPDTDEVYTPNTNQKILLKGGTDEGQESKLEAIQ